MDYYCGRKIEFIDVRVLEWVRVNFGVFFSDVMCSSKYVLLIG